MDTDGPEAHRSELPVNVRVLEIRTQAQNMKTELIRNLLLGQSIVIEGPASQPQVVPQPSSSPARDSRAPAPAPALASASAPALASASAPARPPRSIRGSRSEFVVEVPAVSRFTPILASRGRRLTQSRALSGRSEGPGGTSSRASIISISSTHENEAAEDAPYVPDTIQAILEGAGLAPYTLSWGENERANMTPRVLRSALCNIFGGSDFRRLEWPKCDMGPPYQYFFCTDPTVQPFAPISVGDRGLVISGPGWAGAQDDDSEGSIFHTFMSTKGGARLRYLGDYKKVTLPQEDLEWSLLPYTCQDRWVKRLFTSKTSAARALRARVKLRDIHQREPTVAEVRGRLQEGRVKEITWSKLAEAFRSGKEKMRVIGVRCERYDAHLALLLSNRVK